MAVRSFEEYFLIYMAEALGQAISMIVVEDGISITINDRERLSAHHETATFMVDILYSSKDGAAALLAAAEDAIDELPWRRPIVMRAEMLSQAVDPEGAPMKWRYTGSFEIRYHRQRSY